MALGRTAKYYRDNPEARKKHRAYQKNIIKKILLLDKELEIIVKTEDLELMVIMTA